MLPVVIEGVLDLMPRANVEAPAHDYATQLVILSFLKHAKSAQVVDHRAS